MKARIKFVEKVTFLAESGTGHAMVIDGAPAEGGRNLGPRPMELLLMGLGACTAVDVVIILEKKREKLASLEVICSGERAAEDPRVWTKLDLLFRLRGRLQPESVRKAIALSEEKYCSVAAMLNKTAKISYAIEYVD